jgi:hypothetical protein
MKVYTEQVCSKLDSICCDACGESCKKEGFQNNEHALLTAVWGYDSKKDLTRHEIDLCEDCFDKVIVFLKSQRNDTLQGKDPFDGIDYNLA